MLTFEWNALRAGDNVFMHEGATEGDGVVPGVVTTVNLRKGYNGVGIRVGGVGHRRVIRWPSPFVVHEHATDERCWRCQAA